MKKILGIVLFIAPVAGYGGVYKCRSSSGAIEYQSIPCAASTAEQSIVDIKPMSPQETQQARMKLQAWQNQQLANDNAKIQAENKRQAELLKQAELQAIVQKAMATEQQAVATHNLAVQAEYQNRQSAYQNGQTMDMRAVTPAVIPSQ